jgi:hypothetical protein
MTFGRQFRPTSQSERLVVVLALRTTVGSHAERSFGSARSVGSRRQMRLICVRLTRLVADVLRSCSGAA